MRTGGGHLDGTLDVVLALDFGQVDVVRPCLPEDPVHVQAHRLELLRSRQESHGFRQVADRYDVEPLNDARLPCIVHRDDQPVKTALARVKRH